MQSDYNSRFRFHNPQLSLTQSSEYPMGPWCQGSPQDKLTLFALCNISPRRFTSVDKRSAYTPNAECRFVPVALGHRNRRTASTSSDQFLFSSP